ncbi:pyridoxamine 5'-phosphate oxidase family protein [Actinoplanes sp. NPDC049265]|uniref:pyridoxamine 5'-phosphate oxidase family protein n=1 Tax=Actinoplanes sp. NPDC049265 TaxID=3363902 RepID=UPI003710948B
MTTPTVEFDGRFSEPGATAVPWAEVETILLEAKMFWLSTVRRDGRPHVTPVPMIFDGGQLHFTVGLGEQKMVNLAGNPRVAVTTGTPALTSGTDVVTEGTAVRVTDRDRLLALAGLWRSRLDWDYEVDGDTYHHQGGTAHVFGVSPAKILAFGKSPYSQTRYRF